MNCPKQITYVIQRGDNLYRIAKHFQTTVPAILSHNPNIDPHNLKIGTSISICPGKCGFLVPEKSIPTVCPNSLKPIALRNSMRVAWEQHVYWTRMLLISIAEKLKDKEAVTKRLLQNPYDIASIFADYYSSDISKSIAQLLTEHLQIGAALITALRDAKASEADDLTRQWYINADKMADAFSGINPCYSRDELRKMLYKHLELTTWEVAMRLAGNYRADIEAFDKVEQEALSMADYFSFGLICQFPQKFS